jgi:MFS family permease
MSADSAVSQTSHRQPVVDVPPALPWLYRDPSFWGLAGTQFLGAFNDNLFKQLMLLLAVPIGAGAVGQQDQQGLATVVFSLPFILFSGYAGFLSDRFSKRPIIVIAKVAEIAVMLLGVLAFLAYGVTGYGGLLVVLFLMGAQSAFFGPGKYGILPEMLRLRDLPRANGFILMTTFFAIIFGAGFAGGLATLVVDRSQPLAASAGGLALSCGVCVAIAVLGTATSLLIRRVPAARPNLRFCWSALTIPPETRRLLARDRDLLLALLASCTFWLVSGVAIQAVNSLGLVQLGCDELQTSLMTAIIAVGIAVGSITAGRMCHGRPEPRVVKIGLWGLVVFLLLISISLPGGRHLLGYAGSLPVLVLLGISSGLFAIPVQVFIQSRPPEGQKGRMIAVMNQANFLAILLSGVLYDLFGRIVDFLDWPRSPIFAMMAVLLLPAALLYRLPTEGEPPGTDEKSRLASDAV